MASYQPKVVAALIKWVNASFPLDPKVKSLADLTDGSVLNMMLADMAPTYTVSDLTKNTSPSKWLEKKKSLEAVHKSLSRYIRNECNHIDPINLKIPVDFNAIAESGDAVQMTKLLTIFLMTAVNSTNTAKYVQIMTTLDTDAQHVIKEIIQNAINDEESTIGTLKEMDGVETLTKDIDLTFMTQDYDLALEQEHATLLTEHENLKKSYADFITRFERLQQSHDDLLKHSDQADRELESFQESRGGDQSEYIQNLRNQLQESNDLIANQEQQAETDRVVKGRQERELKSLRPSAEKLIEVEDQLKELKTENAALSRKANTLDHFQKKLEVLANVERDNANLRQQIDTLQANQREFDSIHEENTKMQMTMAEYQKRFDSYELDVVELATQKKILENDLRQKDAQIQSLLASKSHDEQFILDLQERQISSPGPISPPSPTTKTTHLTLEEELEQSDPSVNYPLEISRLKAEIQLLKSSNHGTTNANLRIELEESDRVKKRLEESLRDLQEKHALGQHQLTSLLSKSDQDKNDAIAATRKLYLETAEELASNKTTLAELQLQLSTRDREVLSVRADLSAVDQEEMDALEELKATNQIITSTLETDLLTLQTKYKNLTTDHEQHKSHLVDALLAKDQLNKQIAALKEQAPGGATSNEEPPRMNEQIQKQDKVIQDLQRRLKLAEESSPDTQKAASEHLFKNLARENALIASAWYDITSRLQSNHVVLQRRQDAPKSWLNKQRQMVNSTTPRR